MNGFPRGTSNAARAINRPDTDKYKQTSGNHIPPMMSWTIKLIFVSMASIFWVVSSSWCRVMFLPVIIEAPGASNSNFTEFIHTCTVVHGTCCSKSQWWPPKPASLLLACLNRHVSKHRISVPVIPQMARNRSALHNVLAQGTSNRDITVCGIHSHIFIQEIALFCQIESILAWPKCTSVELQTLPPEPDTYKHNPHRCLSIMI